MWLDDAVGTIRAKLRTLGLDENTIFIYKSDHGVMGKGTVYNDGSRVPLLWKWAGHIPAGKRCDAMVQNIDFLPTLVEVLELRLPPGQCFDGVSYATQLRGSEKPLRDEYYNEYGTTRSVQTSRWNYIALRYRISDLDKMKSGQVAFAMDHSGHSGYNRAAMCHGHYWDADQLYDLHHDPDEQINLAGRLENQDVLQDMKQRLERHRKQFPSVSAGGGPLSDQ